MMSFGMTHSAVSSRVSFHLVGVDPRLGVGAVEHQVEAHRRQVEQAQGLQADLQVLDRWYVRRSNDHESSLSSRSPKTTSLKTGGVSTTT